MPEGGGNAGDRPGCVEDIRVAGGGCPGGVSPHGEHGKAGQARADAVDGERGQCAGFEVVDEEL